MKAKKPTRGSTDGAARSRGHAPGRKPVRSREAINKKQAGGRRGPAREPGRAATDVQPRGRKPMRESRPQRSAPRTNPAPRQTQRPTPRPVDHPVRPKSASQAKARAKARKAKAPKVVRPPLRQRLQVRLAAVDLHPRRLVARVPFVVLVIGSLGLGLGVTLWLSTDAAERSYQLGNARQLNQALLQQKEALERDVLEAQAAPALAEAARELGMIPSRDTARLVQDPAGNWVVVGSPKPAEGVPPPPLNVPLPEPAPEAAADPQVGDPLEVPVRVPSPAGAPNVPGSVAPPGQAAAPGAEVPHAVAGQLPPPGPVPALPPAAPMNSSQLPPAPTGAPMQVAPPAQVPAPAAVPALPPAPALSPDAGTPPAAPVVPPVVPPAPPMPGAPA